jgi:hypothetical protein
MCLGTEVLGTQQLRAPEAESGSPVASYRPAQGWIIVALKLLKDCHTLAEFETDAWFLC